MFERYTLSTTSFPSQTFDETGCDYFLFHTPGKKDHITVDIHYSLEHHNRIHTEEVDLLKLKEFKDLPSLYPLFQLPYRIDVKVTCTGYYVYIEIIYIDSSPDPDIFVPYVYSEPSDETIRRLYGIPFYNFNMSTPTNIPETPMGETEQDSFFKSKEKFQQQLQNIFQTILRLTGPDHFD